MKEIELAQNIIECKNKELLLDYFYWLYPFTNENINAYYDYFDFSNKDVLAVTSSGDHALNAILLNVKNIDTFDTNPLSKYYSELKIAAIKSLSYEEFLEFFFTTGLNFKKNKNSFNNSVYFTKISKNLVDEYKEFWDYLFMKYDGLKLRNSILFSNDYPDSKAIMSINKYLNKDNYYILKRKLNNVRVNYSDLDIKDLDKLEKKYDLVLLSNIACYLNIIYKKSGLKNFKKVVDALNKNGKTEIVLSYLYYNYLDFTYFVDDIYNEDKVSKYFSDNNFEYKWFESTNVVSSKSPLKKIFIRNDGILKTK